MNRIFHRLTDWALIAAFVMLAAVFVFSPVGLDDYDENVGFAAVQPGTVRVAVRPGDRKTFALQPLPAPRPPENSPVRADRPVRFPVCFSPCLLIPLRT